MRGRRPLLRLAAGVVGAGTAQVVVPQRSERQRQSVDEQAPPSIPASSAQMLSIGSNVASNADRAAALVRALQASATGDSSVVKDLYTGDVKGWSPAQCVFSAAELAVELEDRDPAFTDVELEVRPLDVSGDRACVEWTMSATHSGPLDLDEDVVMEPTGLRCTLHGVTVAEFEGDRIRSFREYWDEAEALVELGLLPST